MFPDKNGTLIDVVLGRSSIDEYLARRTYFGAVLAICNWIANGKFMLEGKEYILITDQFLHGQRV